MRKRIISESFENRMQELSGIIQENAHKIMKLGFDNRIADYLANIDKKRGLFLADSLTTQYIKDNGLGELEGLPSKEALSSINQEDLFNYMKSRENESLEVLDFIKQSGGQVDLRSLGGFNDIIAAAKADKEQGEDEGFNPDVENYLRGLDYDFGNDIGIISLKGFFKHKNPGADTKSISVSEMIKLINQEDFLRFLKENEDEIQLISDWISSPVRRDIEGPLNPNFLREKGFDNLGEALFTAINWHDNIPPSGEIDDVNIGKVIKRYPDGYFWKDLEVQISKDEGKVMQHCGIGGPGETLISLRSPTNSRHVTIAYNEDSKNIAQVKGKQNKRPDPKYMKYVFDFLNELVKEDKIHSFNWAYNHADLTNKEVDEILSNLSAKAKFKLAKKGAVRKAGRSNLGVRY